MRALRRPHGNHCGGHVNRGGRCLFSRPLLRSTALAGQKTFEIEQKKRSIEPRQCSEGAPREIRCPEGSSHKAGAHDEGALIDHLPSIERVLRDLKGTTPRDTAGRTAAALHWLGVIANAIPGGRAKASAYAQARDEILASNPNSCAKEPGCTTTGQSRFYWCHSSYENSPEFLRALADKYLPETAEGRDHERTVGPRILVQGASAARAG